MGNIMKRLEEAIPNEYEAVLVAAKLSRKINAIRQAAKEQMAVEDFSKVDQRKVTSVAMEELADGKVKFGRIKTQEEEESFDLT